MHALLVVLVAASQLLYEAKVATFGCNSSAEVAKLVSLRSDKEAFEKLLYTQVAYGQCIAIAQGAVIAGAPEDGNADVLRLGEQIDPPGYMAPSSDFNAKAGETSK